MTRQLPFEWPSNVDPILLHLAPLTDRMPAEDREVLNQAALLWAERQRELEDYLAGLTGGAGARWGTAVVASPTTHVAGQATADFMCTGTGDEAVINDALQQAGSGRVVLLDGSYSVSNPIQIDAGSDGISFGGMGRSTLIGRDLGYTGGIIHDDGNTGFVTLRDFVLWDAHGQHGNLYMRDDTSSEHWTVDNVTFFGDPNASTTEAGFEIDGSFHKILACSAYAMGRGLLFDTADHCRAIGCSIDFSWLYGAACNSGSSHNTVMACGLSFAQVSGLLLAGSFNKAFGNDIDFAQEHGLVASGSDGTVIGNGVRACSQKTHNTYDGIHVSGDRNNVQMNPVRHGGFAKRHRYGARVEAGATDNMVTNNDLLDAGQTLNFSDVGTGTITTAGNRV